MATVRVRYQTLEVSGLDLHVRSLRDNQQFADADGEAAAIGISSAMWPHFGQIWASGRALAQLMSDYPVADRRVLEVGCGLGLASLVLNHRGADITATDRHPEAGRFLAANVRLNEGDAIPFERTSWVDTDDTLGTFELIIGSDLLYEDDHPMQLAGFIDRHAAEACEVLLLDPGRRGLGRFDRQMTARGFGSQTGPAEVAIGAGETYTGRMIRCTRR